MRKIAPDMENKLPWVRTVGLSSENISCLVCWVEEDSVRSTRATMLRSWRKLPSRCMSSIPSGIVRPSKTTSNMPSERTQCIKSWVIPISLDFTILSRSTPIHSAQCCSTAKDQIWATTWRSIKKSQKDKPSWSSGKSPVPSAICTNYQTKSFTTTWSLRTFSFTKAGSKSPTSDYAKPLKKTPSNSLLKVSERTGTCLLNVSARKRELSSHPKSTCGALA